VIGISFVERIAAGFISVTGISFSGRPNRQRVILLVHLCLNPITLLSVQCFHVFESACPDNLEESEDLASQLKEFGPETNSSRTACARHQAATEPILSI
jgi:hypothetical protein